LRDAAAAGCAPKTELLAHRQEVKDLVHLHRSFTYVCHRPETCCSGPNVCSKAPTAPRLCLRCSVDGRGEWIDGATLVGGDLRDAHIQQHRWRGNVVSLFLSGATSGE
jgi:hypothetical protein